MRPVPSWPLLFLPSHIFTSSTSEITHYPAVRSTSCNPTMATTIEQLEELFDDHPSLDASLQDFEPGSSEIGQSPHFGYPSHHSGFRSDTESENADSTSGGRYSPPAWRRDGNGNRSSGFWNRQRTTLGKRSRGSRDSSPEYESADDGEDAPLAAAARTRLPTGSLSPDN